MYALCALMGKGRGKGEVIMVVRFKRQASG